jgi:hypothetical protein
MTVLVAYADTPEGRAALRHGETIAAREGRDLLAFDLDGSTRAADRRTDPPVPGTSARWYTRAADSHNAAAELVDLSDELGVDLIIVGVRRRTPIGKLVLGSNAQQIIIDAHVPVLAVKGDRDDH